MKVFIDTNVLLDVLGTREPFYTDSARVWTLCESGRIQGFISVISFTNGFYVLRKLKGREVAYHGMILLRDIFEPIPLDRQLVHKTIDAGFSDFEDAVQFFSALQSGAACLITRNKAHFPTDQIPVQTPTEFLATHFAEEEW